MKKKMTCILALALAFLLLTACSGAGQDAPTSAPTAAPATAKPTDGGSAPATSEPAQTPAETGPKHVELLRIGTDRANDTFNLTTQGGAFGVMNYNSFVAGLLWERDEFGKPQPGAIKSYSISIKLQNIFISIFFSIFHSCFYCTR